MSEVSPGFFTKIKEKFGAMKERSAQAKVGKEQAKDAEANMSLNDKLKQRIDKLVTNESKLSLDAQVEKAWLEFHRKIYDALGEGKIKQTTEKLAPLFAFKAKAERVSSHVTDIALDAISAFYASYGLFFVGRGRSDLAGASLGIAGVSGSVGFSGLTEKFSIFAAQLTGDIGERTIKITNKILHKPMSAKT